MERSDAELVMQYRAGDVQALELLVSRYRRLVFGYAWNMCGNDLEAEELFQEVWLRAIKGIGSYRERNFKGWLMRIAHNLMVDRWRSRKDAISLDDGEETGAAMLAVDGRADPASAAAESDIAGRMTWALGRLPEEQREVVLMRTKGGLSFKEIAKAQGVSINTALARMQYGLSKLRQILRKDFEAIKEAGT